MNYADRRVLEEHFESAMRWVDYVLGQNPNLLWVNSRSDDYSDWLNGDTLILEGYPKGISAVPKEVLATAFFALLFFAALTSAISLLEVATAYFIDEKGWSRSRAVLLAGLVVALLAIPSALTGSSPLLGARMEETLGHNWFDLVADISSNWALPFGGMGIALFVSWRLPERLRRAEFSSGSGLARFYAGWLVTLRFVVPVAIAAVFLHAVGVF